MDHLSFRLAQPPGGQSRFRRRVGNCGQRPEPAFQYRRRHRAGRRPPAPATLDGKPVAAWCAVRVKKGQTLRIGASDGPGLRAYLAIRHGFDVPDYLGSKSTFTLGLFGGHAGRAVRAGDVLRVRATAQ